MGKYLGNSWCHGVLAVLKKSHPHPKGSDNDCKMKLTFVKSIGMTKAIQSIIPIGRIEPDNIRNAFLAVTLFFDNLVPANAKK